MRAASVHSTYPRTLARVAPAPLSATGRGWAHSPSSWQRAAPGRRAEWLEIREARWQPFPVKCRSSAEPATAPCGSRCDGEAGNGPAGSQSVAPGLKSPTRVPQGSPGTRAGSQGARRGSQGGATEASRAGWYRPRVADEAPAYPSHLRPFTPGTDGAWVSAEANIRMSISQTRPSLSAFDAAPRLTSGRRALRRSSRTRA